MTAPTPERRVGEEWLTVPESVAACKWTGTYGVEWHTEAVAQRAANARLAAEVERLTKEKAEAVAVAEEATAKLGLEGYSYTASGLRRRLATLSLPTPAPEATE